MSKPNFLKPETFCFQIVSWFNLSNIITINITNMMYVFSPFCFMDIFVKKHFETILVIIAQWTFVL